MRKAFLVLLIALACMSSVFALGGAEETSIQEVRDDYVPANAPMRGFLVGLAGIFDDITLTAVLGVTPFPSMLTRQGDDLSSSIFAIASNDSATAQKEKAISSTIGAIFISCIVAEILYIAIFKCFLMGDYAIAKQVAGVFLKGMCIFFIVINLPVLIELVRQGFQELAYIIAGAYLDTDSSLLEMRDSVFKMPGTLIRSCIDIIELIDPNNAGASGVSVIEATEDGAALGTKTIVGYMVQILYWVVQLICVICLCITAFHVMFNIIEVYLLIGIVAVLAPFQIFDLTRFLGEKAIYSLFVNLVELFVLMVIMYSCMNVMATFQEWIMETYVNQASQARTIMYEIPVTSGLTNAQHSSFMSLAAEYEIPVDSIYSSYSDYQNARQRYLGHGRSINPDEAFTDILEAAQEYIIVDAMKSGELRANPADGTPEQDGDLVFELGADLLWDLKAAENAADDGTLFASLSNATKTRAIDIILNENSLYQEFGGSLTTWSISTDIVPIHLCSGLIVIFMMFYFLGQSTQITNAIMSGNAATDSFGSATMKMAAGRAIGYVSKIGSSGTRMVGMGAKNINNSLRNSITPSQHVTNMSSRR